jgi:N-methylhydantoinase B
MSPKQRLLTLEAGETVRMETPGGGGLGQPHERPIKELTRDLEDGRINEETARRDYGDEMVDQALSG